MKVKLKMKIYLTLNIVFFLLLISCNTEKTNTSENFYNIKLKNWNIETIKGITDTVNIKSSLPNSELSLIFQKKGDTICQKPNLDFYPIELESYIEKRLMNYLIYRATLFPKPPNIYTTEKYIVLGWNFEKSDIMNCNLSELEQKIQQKLSLKRKFNPVNIDFKKMKLKQKTK